MLVLTRRTGESFYLGDDIKITISSVRGESVRVAIEAPQHVNILRAELKEAADINKEAAAPLKTTIEALREGLKL